MGIRIASKVYSALINFADPKVPGKLRPLWNHPAGPKTIFFWSPGMRKNLNFLIARQNL
jgi:mitochondrial pyruvate carrier 2